MHPLLAWPYAAAARAAEWLAHAPLPREAKLARALRARRGVVSRFEAWGRAHRDPARPLLWMHAPSVGEGLQARPVLERLRARHPRLQLAYTFFSPSAERFAASLGADFADFLPFDRPASVARAVAALRPTALVFSKLDLWPNLAAAAHAAGARLGMVSATLAGGSGRQSPIARALLRDAYARLDAVGAIDPDDAARLAALGVRPDRIAVTGDTRYDQVWARTAAAERAGALLAPLARPASAGPTLVAGSTWPADEAVLLPAWARVRAEVPGARLVIAPHEPTPAHLAPLRAWAAREGLALAPLGDADGTHDVVLVDRVGVLGDLYALADAAFVGGGFHAAGLHSVLEPAAFGAPVLFGPRHANSRDAGLLVECGGGVAVRDADALAEAIAIALGEPDTRARAGAAARSLVEQGLGAADRSAALVERLLELAP